MPLTVLHVPLTVLYMPLIVLYVSLTVLYVPEEGAAEDEGDGDADPPRPSEEGTT